MRNKLKSLSETIDLEWKNIGVAVHEFAEAVKDNSLTDAELVDCGYWLRQMEQAFDEMRKECKARKELVARCLAAKAAQMALQGDFEVKFEGIDASGFPDVKVMPKLPKQGTDEYVQLLRFFKIPEDVIEQGALRVSFEGMRDILTERASRGENPPEGIIGTYVDAMVTFRSKKRRKVDE